MRRASSKVIFTDALCLFIICLVITFAVAGTRSVFKERIAKQEWDQTQSVMSQLIKAEDFKEVKVSGENQGYKALDSSGKTLGYLFVTKAYGYGSDVSVMSAVKEGKIVGVDVLDASNETPGLGQNVTKKDFVDQFAGLNESLEVVKNDPSGENQVEAVTGATKSSNAVAASVKEALVLFEQVAKSEK
ncbi:MULTISPECIES: FMN-binding protein [Enterococcus]|uniref:FMN-binding protein n=1 Tax=Enterococcus TaxID=1350 RepID=UPI0008D22A21|nr:MULTISPECIES: FMN-binding protein [Enterococcus]BBM17426.1 electron transport complex subunit G [Enterococcus avium]SES62704.1 electron transport complex protein RnfG [Enterococcus malodoratus]HCM86689.1 FMN-binding protein [Enterococcus sp.]